MKKNSPLEQFRLDIAERSASYHKNKDLEQAKQVFHNKLVELKYPYNFFWLGVPIIQTPTETQAFQEIIWEVKPDLIIETGIAWGGSIIFSASMMAILEACGKIKKGHVIGIDIDIRQHNKKNILAHPLSKKITMLEGSSTDENIIKKVKEIARNKKRVLIRLDSNHTHDHVLAELRAYSPLVSKGSYCVVDDTGIEDENWAGRKSDRPWGKGNNPKTAVWQFIKENKDFKIDKTFESKFILLGLPDGFLKKIK